MVDRDREISQLKCRWGRGDNCKNIRITDRSERGRRISVTSIKDEVTFLLFFLFYYYFSFFPLSQIA